jgi:hypothetical protein
MQFYQHIYGRVAKGYRSGSPGYQLAALDESLIDRQDMIDTMNKLSFFNLRDVQGGEARYSFYRPADGFLAFGCSRLARDRTGAIGSFAHHFVCTESDFVHSQISPAVVLQYLVTNSKFLENEAQLPSQRTLSPVEFEPSVTIGRNPNLQSAACKVANLFLDKSERTIPLIVTSDAVAWELLGEVFSLLPQLEAARVSFSTLFTEASTFVNNFRLVFIPDRKYLPSDTYNYTILEPPNQNIARPQSPVALIKFWFEAPEAYPAMLRLTHILRHQLNEVDEGESLFAELISHGKSFRDCIEMLEAPRVFELVLRKKDWIVCYAHSGSSLKYEDLSTSVWEHREKYLPELLAALPDVGQQRLTDDLLLDVARHIIKDEVDLNVLGQLVSRELDHFFELTSLLSIDDRCRLAEKLKAGRFYASQLHNKIARYMVAAITEGHKESWFKISRWLLQEENVLWSQPFARVALDLARWLAGDTEVAPRVREHRMTEAQYNELVDALWAVAISRRLTADTFDSLAYHGDHRPAYYAFLLRRLSDSTSQKAILSIMAKRYGSQATQDPDFIVALERSSKAAGLAQYFLAQLEECGDLNVSTEKILKSIIKKSSWGIF